MKAPILNFFDDNEIIDKDSYIEQNKDHFENMDLVQKYNIDTCLFIFVKDRVLPTDILDKCKKFYTYTSASNENWVYIYDNKFLLAQSPLGGPAASGLMEELGFMGIKNFFACGSAGLINHNFDGSKFVLIDKSIRDEGVSYHYLKKSIYVNTDNDLTNYVANFLDAKKMQYEKTISWCNDAFYRETQKAIDKRLKQGAVAVEMESAGWAAVAKYRGYRFAKLLYFSDAVKQSGWVKNPNRKELKLQIIRLMIDCVSGFSVQ